jgi:hypothetical protein
MGPEQQRLTPDERANLVAYLDHELGEAERDAIATKLAHSPTARRELEALKRTWEMLDHLPVSQASPSLISRTLTQALDFVGTEERIAGGARRLWKGFVPAILWFCLFVGSLSLGFVLTRWLIPNPTARLARHLSVAEHLDEYESVGGFEFLELLEHSPNF